eukprot:6314550-Alexandrium_andersonii.AAC.1
MPHCVAPNRLARVDTSTGSREARSAAFTRARPGHGANGRLPAQAVGQERELPKELDQLSGRMIRLAQAKG